MPSRFCGGQVLPMVKIVRFIIMEIYKEFLEWIYYIYNTERKGNHYELIQQNREK